MPISESLTSEVSINNYYNTVSDNLSDNTYYRRRVSHGMSHSVLGGGVFYLDGFRVDGNHEWQILHAYSNRNYYRDKINGSWQAWKKYILNSDITTGGIKRLSFTSNTDRIILYYILNDASDSNWYRLYVDATGIKFEKRIDGVTTTIWSK